VPEALARIVEVYLALGLVDEAKRTAAVLGYNDPGSVWYQDAYNDLAASGAVSEGLPAPSNGSSGFFGRAWHALF
jgi:outer membrane protein assembly factor BamD